MHVTPRLNLLQRGLNRLGRPLAISPFPVAFVNSLPERGQPARTVFKAIFDANYWDDSESVSGGGSTLARTAAYRAQLVELIKARGVTTLFDAPCGDLNWMPNVIAETGIAYQGGDIVPGVVDAARRRNPSLAVRLFDICTDAYPPADIWHCRDTLFHLSFADIWLAFEKAARSSIGHVLLTTHKARLLRNLDIETGGFRLLDLERAPFNLPPAETYLADSGPGEFNRAVGLWPMSAIRNAVATRS